MILREIHNICAKIKINLHKFSKIFNHLKFHKILIEKIHQHLTLHIV
jgi:hypothetical protein